jgi:hypothetical protein
MMPHGRRLTPACRSLRRVGVTVSGKTLWKKEIDCMVHYKCDQIVIEKGQGKAT